MLSITQLFRPRSQRFHSLFAEVATNISDMERVFHQFVYENEPAICRAQFEDIRALEHKNDLTTHRLIIELGRNFVTPFDREDIHALVTALDDIADYMYAIAKQRINYGMSKLPRETQRITEKLKFIVRLLCEMLHGLREKHLLKLVVLGTEVRKLLHDCDQLVDIALTHLFTERSNALTTIKTADHFKLLQQLLDKSGNALNVLESIVVKYN